MKKSHKIFVEPGVKRAAAVATEPRIRFQERGGLGYRLRFMDWLKDRSRWVIVKPVARDGSIQFKRIYLKDGVTYVEAEGRIEKSSTLVVPKGYNLMIRNHFRAINRKDISI